MSEAEIVAAAEKIARRTDHPLSADARKLLEMIAEVNRLKAIQAEQNAVLDRAIERAQRRCEERARLGILNENDQVPTREALRAGMAVVDQEGRMLLTENGLNDVAQMLIADGRIKVN